MVKRHKKSWCPRFIASFCQRLLCKRNIIIISDRKTDHIPLSSNLQLFGVMGFIGFVTWASFSTGSYMAAEQILAEKDKKLATTALENQRIENEFAMLKDDLSKMIEQDKANMSQQAKQVLEQYKDKDLAEAAASSEATVAALSDGNRIDHERVFERIASLENEVKTIRDQHHEFVLAVRDTTKGKIEEIETAIAMTGLNTKPVEKRAAKEIAKLDDSAIDPESGMEGGPYFPVDQTNVIAQKDVELYQDLQRMMLLKQVVDGLPLGVPMDNAKKTSGFGMRIDPFRKTLARHTGLDFAGLNPHSPIKSTSDGEVVFTGYKNGYGKTIEIDHGLGITTLYGHLSQIKVIEGQKVSAGEVIGIEGSTGRSTGEHLHYEVRYNDAPLNPANFLKAGRYVSQN